MKQIMARAMLGAAATMTLGAGPLDWPVVANGSSWSAEEQREWYTGTQGSRLLPLAWANALERADSPEHFFTTANLARYGYPAARDTDRLPIGFAADRRDDEGLTYTRLRWKAGQHSDERWLGLNCAACHTAVIAHAGRTRVIDGGPTLADFQSMMRDFDRALEAAASPAKFDRFAVAVLGVEDSAPNRAQLREALASLIAWEARVARINQDQSAIALQYGPGRLDAFGHIYNKVALLAAKSGHEPPINASDAPVSYPFLWNVAQSDVVQWNGIAPNHTLGFGLGETRFDYGALGRNTGEVIGVFGDVRVEALHGLAKLGGFDSSIDVEIIAGMELLVARLRPPAWPADWREQPDKALVAAGKTLFQRDCVPCHQQLAPNDLSTRYTASMQWLASPLLGPGTDPSMACNAWEKAAPTGNLEGMPEGYVKGGAALPATARLAGMLRTTVVGALVHKAIDVAEVGTKITFGVPVHPRVVPTGPSLTGPSRRDRLEACAHTTDPLLAYKARPLTGIWATAPYLHNGSVPTLWDLLLPPDQRPSTFMTGTREYDPVHVGYRTGPDAPGNRFVFNTALPGNWNRGHDYGNASLTPTDRAALVEYLKTL